MLEDLQIRNYAASTVRAYILRVAEFAKHFGKSPDQLGAEQIREYQLFLIKQKQVSQSAYIQTVSGLRFLYTHTLNVKSASNTFRYPDMKRSSPLS
jgi:integrase/recombinase XerD